MTDKNRTLPYIRTERFEDNLIDLLQKVSDQFARDGDLYNYSFVQERLLSLSREHAQILKQVIERGCIKLNDAHDSSELVIEESFDGTPESVFRGVHFVQDSDFMASDLVQAWHNRILDAIRNRSLRAMRRMVVYESAQELNQGVFQFFMRYEKESSKFETKYLKASLYREMLHTHHLGIPHDFGIYSRRYAFVSESSDPASLKGTWYFRRDHVDEIIEFFDRAWEASSDSIRSVFGET